jgi:Asp-tRNA(Asn)/Glu-tRNA(Gln) amidotransferase A subunit family amidase
MSPQNLCYLSASEALRAFREGTLTPPDYLEALLTAAAGCQDSVNASTVIHADEARRQAQQALQRWRDGTARPLEGIPVIVKEETAVRGWNSTFGSEICDEVAEEDHPIIDKLRRAGAIFHVQATNPEFCCLGHTWSRRWGVTRNPWNLEKSCGGSSGGSGAALAAGLGPLATGSDMGGSIRLPAAMNGVYGFKPPSGRLPPSPGDELFGFAVEGPMARSFEDLVLMQNVIAGPHPDTYATVPFTPLPQRWRGLEGVRIAYCPSLGAPTMAREVRANMDRALAALQKRGAVVQSVDLRWDMAEIGHTLMEGIMAVYYAEFLEGIPETDRARLCSYNQDTIRKFLGRPNSLAKAADLAAAMHREMQAKVWGQGFDALVCGTTLGTDFAADQDPVAEPSVSIEGVAVDAFLAWALTPAFNLLSRYPVMAVPTGRDGTTGVPTSLQVVANSYNDEMVFRIAHHLDASSASALFKSEFPSF